MREAGQKGVREQALWSRVALSVFEMMLEKGSWRKKARRRVLESFLFSMNARPISLPLLKTGKLANLPCSRRIRIKED